MSHLVLGTDEEGDRYRLWPVGFGLHKGWSHWGWHGWQCEWEEVSPEKTSRACVPGYRRVFGQTLHFGRLYVTFGPRSAR